MSEEGKGGSREHDEGGGTSRTKPRETRATRRGRNQGEEADLHSDGAEPCTKKKKNV